MRRPLTLPFLLLAASALAAPALAAPVTLNVADDGWEATTSRTYPPAPGMGGGSAFATAAANGGKITLSNIDPGEKVFAFNAKTNLAVVGNAKDLARTTIAAEGATHLVRVTVNLTDAPGASGMPYVREASVELKDGDRAQSEVTVGGTVNFAWAKIGDATITVKTRGADNKPRIVTQKVTLDRDGLSGFTVPVTNEPSPAAAVGAAADRAVGVANAPPPASTGGSVLGNLLSLVIGLAVVGGLGFAAWRYARANPDKTSELLGKIGADVPKPLDPDPPATIASAAPPAPAAPSGPIILDPTPQPIQIPQAQISVAPIATGIPKLVGSDGSAFELPEGETVVGREALGGLMISHDTVSRRHARLLRSGSSVSVEDLGSTNGTWVNDAPTPAALSGGETVRFGQVSYRYEA